MKMPSMPRDTLLLVAGACALVVMFDAEYTLAKAVGINDVVAVAVPGALDVYMVRALQMRRDVLACVIVTITVNAVSHLVTAGQLPVHWSVIVGVSAIAPLVLWRVDFLRARVRVLWDEGHTDAHTEHTVLPGWCEEHACSSDRCTHQEHWGTLPRHESTRALEEQHAVRNWDAHVASVPGVRDLEEHTVHRADQDFRSGHARRSTDPAPVLAPQEHADAHTEHTPGVRTDEEHTVPLAKVLTLRLPDGFEHTQEHGEHTPAQRAAAEEHASWYVEHTQEHGVPPSLRTVKACCSVSTDTARAMLKIWKEEESV